MAYSVVLTCSQCGQNNRAPVGRLAKRATCGACKSPLPPPGEPIDVGDAELGALLAESALPVVVDFWAPWCGPCRMVGPPLATIARELAGRVLIAKVNVDDNPRSAAAYQARSIPLIIGFAEGKEVKKQLGALPPPALRAWVEGLLAD